MTTSGATNMNGFRPIQNRRLHTEGCTVNVELDCYFCVLQGGLNTSK